jgi:hypothetical protein
LLANAVSTEFMGRVPWAVLHVERSLGAGRRSSPCGREPQFHLAAESRHPLRSAPAALALDLSARPSPLHQSKISISGTGLWCGSSSSGTFSSGSSPRPQSIAFAVCCRAAGTGTGSANRPANLSTWLFRQSASIVPGPAQQYGLIGGFPLQQPRGAQDGLALRMIGDGISDTSTHRHLPGGTL